MTTYYLFHKLCFTFDCFVFSLASYLSYALIVFFACSRSPFSLLVLMKQPDYVPGWIYMIAIIMAHGNSSVNSLLYGLTNEKFRQGYQTVLGLRTVLAIKKSNGNIVKDSQRLLSSCKSGKKSPYCPPTIASVQASISGLENGRFSVVSTTSSRMDNGSITAKDKRGNGKEKSAKKLSLSTPSVADQLLSPNGIVIFIPDSPWIQLLQSDYSISEILV